MHLLKSYPDLALPMVIFLTAFFIGLHLTGGLQRLAQWVGIVDKPGGRKKQTVPVPCLGGAAIYIALMASLGIALLISDTAQAYELRDIAVILCVGTAIFFTGLFDDIRPIPAMFKLGVLAVGCVVLSLNGIGVNRTPYLWVNALLTFLWVAGVSSAFNAIDNKDGLAGGVALVSAFALFGLGWSTWQIQFSFLAMALAGSVLGFLHHNMNPAKIYMGDSGSFTIGYFLAVLVIYGEWAESPLQSLICGGLVVALPVYDLGLTSLLRVRYGIVHSLRDVISHSDTDHLSHRLLKLGLSHRQMLSVLIGAHAICCLAGTYLANEGIWATLPVLSAVALMLLLLARYVNRASARASLWTERQPSRPEWLVRDASQPVPTAEATPTPE